MSKAFKCGTCDTYFDEKGGRVILEVRGPLGELRGKQMGEKCERHLDEFMHDVNLSKMKNGLVYVANEEGDPNV